MPPKTPPLSAPTGKAEMPAVVREDGIAKDEWLRLAPQLELLGLIDPTNQQLFAGYCLSFSLYVRAKRQVLKEGFTYKPGGEKGGKGQIKKHPAFEAMRAAGAEMRKFGIEFGITPASRGKVTAATLQPTLPGVPEKPNAPEMGGENNERFFGSVPPTLN